MSKDLKDHNISDRKNKHSRKMHIYLKLMAAALGTAGLFFYAAVTERTQPDPTDSTQSGTIRSTDLKAFSSNNLDMGSILSLSSMDLNSRSLSNNETYLMEEASYNGTKENEESVMTASDRYTYKDGFFYQSITDDVKARINGLSYKEDCTVPYEDLRYVSVLYEDFDGETRTGEIICNKAIAQDLVEIFYELYCAHYQIDKIRLIDEYDADDDLSCADNNTSCFNFRKVYGSDNLSKHALGLAIDINPFQNPYVTYPDGVERISPPGSEPYGDRGSGLPHMITENDLCYQLFTAHGFTWGGNWRTLKDYQHFQKEL